MKLEISQEIIDAIIAHAKAILPNECCGYLAGRQLEDFIAIEAIYKMTNTDNKPDHFTMDPKEQFSAMKDARSKGLSLSVVYHSHPETPARPSEEDLRLLVDPNMVYVIISMMDLTSPSIKAFQIKNKEATELSIKIKQGKAAKL